MSWLKIETSIDKLPPAQKKIAAYMLANREKSIFMTAVELGNNSKSSEASAVRLAYTLGFSSFPEFLKSLRKEAQNQLSTINRLQIHKLLPNERGYVAGIIAKELSMTKDYLSSGVENDMALKRLAADICKADAIYLVGLRSARSLAQYMEYYLSWFFPKVFTPSYENLCNYLSSAPKRSLTIGISFPRYTKQTVEGLAFARARGFKTAAITDSLDSPLAKVADTAVIAPCAHIAHIDSLMIPLGLINALLIQVAERLGSFALKRLEELENNWERQDVYC